MFTWFKRLVGKGAKRPEQIVRNPYAGLTATQLIERRRALHALHSAPPLRTERKDDDLGLGFGVGMLMGSSLSSMGGAPSVPVDTTTSFEPGGGDMGGGGASESWGSGSSDSGGGGGE